MWERWKFAVKRARERLWVKPLLICVLSIIGVFVAHLADGTGLHRSLPAISKDSNESLLKIMAGSMLVMATFAVASMVAAYASASSSATPRTFSLIISDDGSQNALSAFIGAFIYSVIALVAQANGYYGKAGLLVLFAMTVFVFAVVIYTFVRWVDNIARLGRLGNTIDRVEAAAKSAITDRQKNPCLGGVAANGEPGEGLAVYATAIGYVQRVDTAALQAVAAKSNLRVSVKALPGTFCTPDRPVARVTGETSEAAPADAAKAIAAAFTIGDGRVFDQDPRFGLIVLSEIASRALSPAMNDPGTAIDVVGTLVRLFITWDTCGKETDNPPVRFDRVTVPKLSLADMFDDAFTGIARDGAAAVEVVVRLQKAFEALAAVDDATMREQALIHARLSLVRAENVMQIPHDLETARKAAGFATA